MIMILIGGVLLAVAISGTSFQATAQGDPAPVVRRIAATAQLAAQEYRVGVLNGRVVASSEVAEARLFLQESRRSAVLLPSEVAPGTVKEIDSLIYLVDETVAPDSLATRVRHLTGTLSTRLNVTLDEIPSHAPSVARGAEVYQANCASCHGGAGMGDGPLARGLEPKPADLARD